jgi:GTPase
MEKVITIGLLRTRGAASNGTASLDELEQLVETAGGQVVEAHQQRRDRPDPASFIGKGKALELAEAAMRTGVQTLVFDDELKPGQQRHLEELTGVKVVDRTRLILDIFAQRARTREGILQVELAQLEYLLPRLTERFGRFEQQVGGIGTRGPGERKLEVDRRRIRDRIAHLKKQIEKIGQERSLQRGVRRSVPVPQVALVGYTNAGKSTLLNALLRKSAGAPKSGEHEVYADDKLFATLDPTTRRIRMPSGRSILFSDTVGFIQKLPTQLVAAFRATLEEVAQADLLMHVVDASDPDRDKQEAAVLAILEQIGAAELPRLTAYNKMDRLPTVDGELFRRGDAVVISATKGTNLEPLLKAVEAQLSKQWIERDLLFGFDEGARLASLHDKMDILSQTMTENGIRVRVRSHPRTLAQWMRQRGSDPRPND